MQKSIIVFLLALFITVSGCTVNTSSQSWQLKREESIYAQQIQDLECRYLHVLILERESELEQYENRIDELIFLIEQRMKGVIVRTTPRLTGKYDLADLIKSDIRQEAQSVLQEVAREGETQSQTYERMFPGRKFENSVIFIADYEKLYKKYIDRIMKRLEEAEKEQEKRRSDNESPKDTDNESDNPATDPEACPSEGR